MKYLIVFANPNPESFGSSLVKALHHSLLKEGNEVEIRDLYQLGFNPILSVDDFSTFAIHRIPDDIAVEQKYVLWSEHIILVYPVWWGGMPAILKGYIDRVFTEEFAYEYSYDGSHGLLSPRKGSTICTAGAFERDYNDVRAAMNLISGEVIFKFIGLEPCKQLFYGGVTVISDIERKSYIKDAVSKFSNLQ
jgi:NAD(P)H dehydrogenase (quinone)